MRVTESEIFESIDEADDFAAEGWPDSEDMVAESAWDTEDAADWEDYPADEYDEDFADESIAIENYADTEYDEETADFGELDTYHAPRRRHRRQPQHGPQPGTKQDLRSPRRLPRPPSRSTGAGNRP